MLAPTMAVKSHIRSGDFFKIISAIETGAEHGMWTYLRYQTWIENRKTWYIPTDTEVSDSETNAPSEPASITRKSPPARTTAQPAFIPGKNGPPSPSSPRGQGGPIEIEPVEGGLPEVLKKLEKGP